MNHAFFKALLFLSAGSVIHALNDEQDMRKMGGLIKIITFYLFYDVNWFFIFNGFSFFTGFYSKDVILEIAYAHFSMSGTFAYWLGCISAFFTAFYSFRLLFLTFFKNPNSHFILLKNTHESSFFMIISFNFISFW